MVIMLIFYYVVKSSIQHEQQDENCQNVLLEGKKTFDRMELDEFNIESLSDDILPISNENVWNETHEVDKIESSDAEEFLFAQKQNALICDNSDSFRFKNITNRNTNDFILISNDTENIVLNTDLSSAFTKWINENPKNLVTDFLDSKQLMNDTYFDMNASNYDVIPDIDNVFINNAEINNVSKIIITELEKSIKTYTPDQTCTQAAVLIEYANTKIMKTTFLKPNTLQTEMIQLTTPTELPTIKFVQDTKYIDSSVFLQNNNINEAVQKRMHTLFAHSDNSEVATKKSKTDKPPSNCSLKEKKITAIRNTIQKSETSIDANPNASIEHNSHMKLIITTKKECDMNKHNLTRNAVQTPIELMFILDKQVKKYFLSIDQDYSTYDTTQILSNQEKTCEIIVCNCASKNKKKNLFIPNSGSILYDITTKHEILYKIIRAEAEARGLPYSKLNEKLYLSNTKCFVPQNLNILEFKKKNTSQYKNKSKQLSFEEEIIIDTIQNNRKKHLEGIKSVTDNYFAITKPVRNDESKCIIYYLKELYCEQTSDNDKFCIIKLWIMEDMHEFQELPLFLDGLYETHKGKHSCIEKKARDILNSFLSISFTYFEEIDKIPTDKIEGVILRRHFILHSRFHILYYLRHTKFSSACFAIYSHAMISLCHQNYMDTNKVFSTILFYFAFFHESEIINHEVSKHIYTNVDLKLKCILKSSDQGSSSVILENSRVIATLRYSGRIIEIFNVYISTCLNNCKIQKHEIEKTYYKRYRLHQFSLFREDKENQNSFWFDVKTSKEFYLECMSCYLEILQYKSFKNSMRDGCL